jgi:hypothetical protein
MTTPTPEDFEEAHRLLDAISDVIPSSESLEQWALDRLASELARIRELSKPPSPVAIQSLEEFRAAFEAACEALHPELQPSSAATDIAVRLYAESVAAHEEEKARLTTAYEAERGAAKQWMADCQKAESELRDYRDAASVEANERRKAHAEIKRLTQETERLKRERDAGCGRCAGMEERCQILLEAKNKWADRARAAEAENTALRDRLGLAEKLAGAVTSFRAAGWRWGNLTAMYSALDAFLSSGQPLPAEPEINAAGATGSQPRGALVGEPKADDEGLLVGGSNPPCGHPSSPQPAPEKEPVCATCRDTHRMSIGDREVMCTHCPVPCHLCRLNGNGAYCASTPCACVCHRKPVNPDPDYPGESATLIENKRLDAVEAGKQRTAPATPDHAAALAKALQRLMEALGTHMSNSRVLLHNADSTAQRRILDQELTEGDEALALGLAALAAYERDASAPVEPHAVESGKDQQ